MQYRFRTDKLINMLVPHFLSGRKYILFLQSLAYPLGVLNDWFVEFVREKQIEANMTSQILYFEWYLNHKFRKYFENPEETIFIQHTDALGVDMHYESSLYGNPYTIWYEWEKISVKNPLEEPKALYRQVEEELLNEVSFHICVPAVTIEEKEFVYLLSHAVNTYRLAGKTYVVKISSTKK